MDDELRNASLAGFDPTAHHAVLSYLRRLWSGAPAEPDFERTTLSRELGFNSLSLAELIFAVSNERNVSLDRILFFLRAGIPGGGDQAIANLLERISILAPQFDEQQRIVLLTSGLVGDPNEIKPIRPEFDIVGMIVKYCRAIESLAALTDHDAVDAETGWVEEDPDWP